MHTIQQQIANGQKYLVIELLEGTAALMKQDEVFVRPEGPGPMQMAVIDLEELLEKFEREAPPRQTFMLTEVATMAQQKGPTVHAWIKADILTPSIRDRSGTKGRAMLFSRRDAFIACLIASLKRKCGLPLSKLERVSDALQPQEPETTQKQKPKRKTNRKKKSSPKSRRTTAGGRNAPS
ncbi:hypothetical protein Mal52_30510 [Symmachiella dynata]|uniref:Uncharacterized protein n=1 Tax=Symmachiella dynata TaxID=2527995 RepID=A0A517ZQ46_9PLAN|nr:hypothetical protein [Symmachiella dynata]QDU44567.1 hypothetical protein Mal52_30510 [Symmachiella dynata]